MLVMSSGMMLTHNPKVVEGFVGQHGFPEGVIGPIGAVELACAVLYAIPQTSVLGAILLTGYLGGAVVTHVRVGESFAAAVVVGVVLWAGLFLREPRLRALVPLRKPE
jgi:hypothetical protein